MNSPNFQVPRFIIGDDCAPEAQSRVFIVHLPFPRMVVQVRFSEENGTNVFSPHFLDDVSTLSEQAKAEIVQEAVVFFTAAWRRAAEGAIA